MHPVSRLIRQRLGGKVRRQAVSRDDGLHHGTEGQGVVGGRQRIGVAKVDLVLSRPLLVVGAFRPDAHLTERQADLAPHIFTPVLGGDVHVTRPVKGDIRCLAVLVGLEQIKLHLRAEGKGDSAFHRTLHGLLEQGAGVRLQSRSVRVGNPAEHAHHLPVFAPPGQGGERGGIGMQEEVGAYLAPEAGDGGGIYGDAVPKGAIQLRRQDGDVFLLSEDITEGQADEAHILLLHILAYFLFGKVRHVWLLSDLHLFVTVCHPARQRRIFWHH